MRYMERFRCIGERCEDNCCHSWTVDIDPRTYDRMKKLTALRSAEERKRWTSNVAKREVGEGLPKIWSLRLLPDGSCPMLEADGLCHVQATFGEKLLSEVCAVYPRRVQKLGEAFELSGMTSCPEIARQLLLHEDACEPAPLDRSLLPRNEATHGMDPRDVRPYWRLLVKVRTFMLGLLRRPGYSFEQRLFFMTWFAKRVSPTLNKSAMKADTSAVMAEMDVLSGDETLAELARRFDEFAPSSAVALLVARGLVRRQRHGMRRSFSQMVDEVFASYHAVPTYLEGDLESAEAGSHAARLGAEYGRRRARLLVERRARIEQYLVNLTHNYWMHRLPLEAPDLMVHMLRLLALLAVIKFMTFSHPSLQSLEGEALTERLDAVAVEVVFRVARYIEHGPLLTDMENLLEQMQLRSLAGAVHLIRF